MTTFKTKILPIITILLIFMFWYSSLSVSYLIMIAPMLFVLLVSYIEFKSNFLKQLGFSSSNFNKKNILIHAPLIAFTLFLIYYYVLLPLLTYITNQPIDYSDFDAVKGNPVSLIFLLIFVWVSAAFGEEIVWRGYFMKQFVKFFGEGKISMTINILLFGILFGLMHSYQGITGQLLTGIIGMILSYIFYKKKYDLWLNVAIHGWFDTIAILALYLNLGQ
ncbi:CPBP family intramembrane glutamic endopeptidase [Tenacibaculum sp. 190524A05c]|uniref:Abortive phage infection protein (CAAX terminal protease) n=1 Tax=Tenacibaculum platacis TaxID=3137852 RepID=A0ABM9P309_9FLAO